MTMMKHLRCGRHGRQRWQATIQCCCGCIYQATIEGVEFKPVCEGAVKAPKNCFSCGADLLRDAVPICTDCFKRHHEDNPPLSSFDEAKKVAEDVAAITGKMSDSAPDG